MDFLLLLQPYLHKSPLPLSLLFFFLNSNKVCYIGSKKSYLYAANSMSLSIVLTSCGGIDNCKVVDNFCYAINASNF